MVLAQRLSYALRLVDAQRHLFSPFNGNAHDPDIKVDFPYPSNTFFCYVNDPSFVVAQPRLKQAQRVGALAFQDMQVLDKSIEMGACGVECPEKRKQAVSGDRAVGPDPQDGLQEPGHGDVPVFLPEAVDMQLQKGGRPFGLFSFYQEPVCGKKELNVLRRGVYPLQEQRLEPVCIALINKRLVCGRGLGKGPLRAQYAVFP